MLEHSVNFSQTENVINQWIANKLRSDPLLSHDYKEFLIDYEYQSTSAWFIIYEFLLTAPVTFLPFQYLTEKTIDGICYWILFTEKIF